MRILAHRGLWHSESEKNTIVALARAMDAGFGFESDIRDYMGHMVISHDIATKNAPIAEKIFQKMSACGDNNCFAINIKADGLKSRLLDNIKKYRITNYFLFDMSIPQMVEFASVGLRFFTRQSEYEKNLVMYDEAAGVWLDGFFDVSWINEHLIKEHIKEKKEVCIVSTDLHGRNDYRSFWERIRGMDLDFSKILLCTDHPEEAQYFFEKVCVNEKN